MKTRYLADSLGLPPDWQAERYSNSIMLTGPHGERGLVVLPYGDPDHHLEALKRKCAEVIAGVIAATKSARSLSNTFD